MPTRTVANGGGNFNVAATWVENAVPTNSDDVVFTATSGQLTVNVASACQSINFTNYTNTITFTNTLTVGGATPTGINLGTGGYTQAGASGIILTASLPMTSNGVTWSRGLTFSGTSRTYTLTDAWTVTGNIVFNGTTTTIINGFTLNAGASVTSNTAATTSGTTNLVMNGNGTWSNSSTGSLNLATITFNTAGTIVVSGTVRAATGVIKHTAGTITTIGSNLVMRGGATLNTSTGMTWATLQPQGTNSTYTLQSDCYCTAVIWNGTTTTVMNGFTLYNSGTTTINQASHAISGTTVYTLTGTGNWSHASTSTMGLSVTINTAGTITFSANGFRCAANGTLLHTSGTLAGTLSIFSTGYRFNCPTIIWTGGMTTQSGTITLLADLKVGGWAIQTNNTVLSGAFILYNSGGLARSTSGTFNATGGATLVMNGTGTWSDGFPTSGWTVPVTINTAGTVTLSGTISVANFTYVSGTVTVTGSTARFNLGATIDSNTMVWNNVLFITGTITLNSLLRVGGILQPAGVIVMAGSFGFTCATLQLGANTLTLPPGVTNTVTTAMNSLLGTLAARALINCSTVAGTKAILNLSPGATQDNGYLSNTDVDSSGGVTIWTYKGVLTREVNWNQLSTDPRKQVLKYGTKIMHYS